MLHENVLSISPTRNGQKPYYNGLGFDGPVEVPRPIPQYHLDDSLAVLSASPEMKKIRSLIERVASLDVPLLLLGESGVGKGIMARLIHRLSTRAQRTFLKINCAALPADLLESELFGYEAGAFTGANKAKPGKFELCHKGTIFLDEIGEMPPCMQAKLLQVLEDRQFSRLGGRSLITVDVRVIAATNVDIEYALSSGNFRKDLYYRLNTFTVHLPPLRKRKEEILPLLGFFMRRHSELLERDPLPYAQDVIDKCMQYDWPGNVRELENFVKRYLILQDSHSALDELDNKNAFTRNGQNGKTMPLKGEGLEIPENNSVGDLKSTLRQLKAKFEQSAIQRALHMANGNRNEAAQVLGISTKALLHKIRQYGLDGKCTADTSSGFEVLEANSVPAFG